MTHHGHWGRLVAALTFGSMLWAGGPAAADPVADFYTGKTVQILIGYSVGGGYDIYGRTLARYMGKHIPGNPVVVPQNMPGAGSLRLVNFLYKAAAKDGTVIGTFARGAAMDPLLDASQAGQYDATKFNWIGSVTNEVSTCVFWHASGIKTWQDMQTKPFSVGGTGPSADTDVFPKALRDLFKLPLKLVTGFPGGADVVLSLERREVDGRCGWSWSSLMSRHKALLDAGQLNVTVQLALAKHEDLPNVPLVMDLTDDPKTKAALKLIFSRQAMARPFAMPPGVPPERVAAIRKAFDETMKDPEFLAEAEKLELEVRPLTGQEVDKLLQEIYATPRDVVKMASDALKQRDVQ